MKFKLIVLLSLSINITFSQSNELQIIDLKPVHENNKFPEIQYHSNQKVEEKINTFLQLEELEHLPNAFKKHPFENVCYDSTADRGSVEFYEWEKNPTTKNILSFYIGGLSVGAYPQSFTKFYNFDIQTGNPILLSELFSKNGIVQFRKFLYTSIRQSISNYVDKIVTNLNVNVSNIDSTEKDRYTEQITLYKYCLNELTENNIEQTCEFYFNNDNIIFQRGSGFNLATQALDDLGIIRNTYTFDKISTLLSDYGKMLVYGDKYDFLSPNPYERMFKGKINNIPISAIIFDIDDGGLVSMQYWYDKIKIPIDLQGRFQNGFFTLEENCRDEKNDMWIINAKINANWVENRKIIGTWINQKTNEKFKFELNVY